MSRLVESLDKGLLKKQVLTHTTNLIKDCKPFLKDMIKGNWGFMYSGRSGGGFKEVFKGKVRKNRKPSDTHPEIHRDLDILFQKKFGYPARSNSVFCTGLDSVAGEYGTAYMIFPIGKYKSLYSEKIDDLYMAIAKRVGPGRDAKHSNGLYNTMEQIVRSSNQFTVDDERFDKYHQRIDPDMEYDDFYSKHYNEFVVAREERIISVAKAKYWDTLQEMVDSYISGDVAAAIYSESEIMITCNEYWAINTEEQYIDTLLESYFRKFGYKGHKNDDDFEEWWSKAERMIR